MVSYLNFCVLGRTSITSYLGCCHYFCCCCCHGSYPYITRVYYHYPEEQAAANIVSFMPGLQYIHTPRLFTFTKKTKSLTPELTRGVSVMLSFRHDWRQTLPVDDRRSLDDKNSQKSIMITKKTSFHDNSVVCMIDQSRPPQRHEYLFGYTALLAVDYKQKSLVKSSRFANSTPLPKKNTHTELINVLNSKWSSRPRMPVLKIMCLVL